MIGTAGRKLRTLRQVRSRIFPNTGTAGRGSMEAGSNGMSLDFAAIDFETANHAPDSACAVGLAIVRDGRLISLERRLIRPPSNEFFFTYVHHLTWDDVCREPSFSDIWEKILPLLSGVKFLAAHNASFDRRILEACCHRYGVSPPRTPFVCTVQLARSVWNIFPTKLPNVCQHLDIDIDHHEAGSDAEACARIVLAAAKRGWKP